jgi:hypothetical protein
MADVGAEDTASHGCLPEIGAKRRAVNRIEPESQVRIVFDFAGCFVL